MTPPRPRFYEELAAWWPLFSPPSHYVEEAEDLLSRLGPRPASRPATLLELGCGGGSLAFHLKRHFRMTLTDRAAGMLAVSQAANPEAEHLLGDMRTLRLDRQFDVVLVHDAVMYATEPADVLDRRLRLIAVRKARSPSSPTASGRRLRLQRTMGERTARMDGPSDTWNGAGIPTRRTTRTRSTTRSRSGHPMAASPSFTIATSKACLRGPSGLAGSPRRASLR